MSTKKKKTDRRKSQIFDLRLKDSSDELANIEENEELKQLYQNKNYQAPELKQFETIYESPSKVRRGLIEEDGTLNIGRGRGQRYIDFASIKYWRTDDKDKNKKRKIMISKQFRGRKRNKTAPLSDQAYDELHALIANKEDTIVESDSEEREENEDNLVVEGFVLNLPGTVERRVMEISQQLENTCVQDSSNSAVVDNPNLSCDMDQDNDVNLHELEQMDCDDYLKFSSTECVWESVKSSWSSSTEESSSKSVAASSVACPTSTNPSSSNVSPPTSHTPSALSSTTTAPSSSSVRDGSGNTTETPSTNSESSSINSEYMKIREETLSSGACASVFDVLSGSPTQEELEKIFDTDDLLFCGNIKAAKPVKKDKKRISVRRSVRRSSRFQSNDSEGSIFAIEEVQIPDRRKKTRKQVPIEGDDEVFEKVEPLNNDRLSVPEQLRHATEAVTVGETVAEMTNKIYETGSRDSVVNSVESGRLSYSSVASEKQSEEACEEALMKTIDKSKRRSSTYKDLSTNLSSSSNHDISLPDVVRRSLTGEFVPRRSSGNMSRMSLEKETIPTKDQVQEKTDSYQKQDEEVENSLKERESLGLNVEQLQTDGDLPSVKHVNRALGRCDEPMHCGVTVEHDNFDQVQRNEALALEDITARGNIVVNKNVMEGGLQGKSPKDNVAVTPASRKSLIPKQNKKDENKKCKSRLMFLSANSQPETEKQKQLSATNSGEMASGQVKDPSRLSVIPKFNEKSSVKSVSEAFFSDSEEEEMISGMFGSKQMSRNMMKEKEKINRGFLKQN